jgi:hypothetical protein
MPKIKTDEQYRNDYIPRINAFTDRRLTGEKAKRIYDFLKPYHYDTDGWRLYESAKDMLQADACSEFPAEDNMGYFEILNGYELLKWLEIAKFADKEYKQLPGGYAKLTSHTLDAESPAYREYQDRLYVAAIKSIATDLIDKQPYLLEGFWNRLAYIENILEKGFPTRSDLNAKLDREAEAAFKTASEGDLTSFHSEAEIKCQLRDALRATSMTDEMVQALYVKDDALDDAYRFFTEESKDNQVYLAVWEYLDKAEHGYLAERVYDRVTLEYEDYKDEVKNWPPQKIMDEAAYKLVLCGDIRTSLDPMTSKLSTEQLKALLSFPSPLWNIYEEWQDRDDTHMDELTDTIRDAADERAMENKEQECEIDPDPFGIGEQEDEDDQEL